MQTNNKHDAIKIKKDRKNKEFVYDKNFGHLVSSSVVSQNGSRKHRESDDTIICYNEMELDKNEAYFFYYNKVHYNC